MSVELCAAVASGKSSAVPLSVSSLEGVQRQQRWRPSLRTAGCKWRSRFVRCKSAAADLQSVLESTLDASKKVALTEREGIVELTAQEGVRKGESVFTITQDKWISLDAVSKSKLGPSVRSLEPWLQLALFLVSEKQNLDSAWRYFLDQLPQDLNSPAFWNDNELDVIKGTQLHESAVGYKQFFQQRYKELEADLFQKNPDVFTKDWFGLESFCWAVGTVRSNMHPPLEAEKLALIPIVSSIGHSRAANVELKLSSGNLFQKTSTLSIQATRDITAGEMLQMNYGPDKSDSQIAIDYGVFDAANPQGGYRLSLQLPESDINYDDKLDILEVCGLQEPVIVEFLPNEDPPAELLLFLRLLNLSGPDAFHLEALFRNEIEDHLAFPVSMENESNICDTMISGCQEALQPYQSIDFKSSPTIKQDLMKKVCFGEQQTLEWVQLWFQRRKENLKGLEYYAERRLKRLGLLDDEGQSTFEDMLQDGIA